MASGKILRIISIRIDIIEAAKSFYELRCLRLSSEQIDSSRKAPKTILIIAPKMNLPSRNAKSTKIGFF